MKASETAMSRHPPHEVEPSSSSTAFPFPISGSTASVSLTRLTCCNQSVREPLSSACWRSYSAAGRVVPKYQDRVPIVIRCIIARAGEPFRSGEAVDPIRLSQPMIVWDATRRRRGRRMTEAPRRMSTVFNNRYTVIREPRVIPTRSPAEASFG